jgi:hypothetical protein
MTAVRQRRHSSGLGVCHSARSFPRALAVLADLVAMPREQCAAAAAKALRREQPRRHVRCRGLRAIKRPRGWRWYRTPCPSCRRGEGCRRPAHSKVRRARLAPFLAPFLAAVPWVLLAPWACGRSTDRGLTRRSTGLAMAHAPHTRPAAASVPDAKVSVRGSQRCAAGV